MSKILRKSLVFVFALCLLLTVGLSIAISSPKALALGTLSAYADDLTMIEGASIYSKYEYGSEKETNTTRGIRFGMTMPKADYDSLLAKASDQGVTVNFGMFIKPNGTAYKYELSQANLFDNGALYYWEDNKLDAKASYPTTNPTTGTTLYSWNAEIYNISRPEIEVTGDVVNLYGFLVGFTGAPAITRDYTCRGYVTLTKGESVTNVLANYSKELGRAPATSVEERAEREALVTRSMAEVAHGVIESSNDATLIANVEARYFTSTVKDVSTDYTVNYYLDGAKKGSKVLQGNVYTNLNASDIVYDESFGYNCSKNLVTLSNASEINAVKAKAGGKTEVNANFVTNHDFANETTFDSNSTSHWKVCYCGEIDTVKTLHTGGASSCSAQAQCTVCKAFYGELESHAYNKQMTDASEHWTVCSACGVEQANSRVAHGGGTATCTAKAVCSTCGESYGNKKAHTYTKQKTSATEHWNTCSACGLEQANSRESHSGGTATCTSAGVCTACNVSYIAKLGHDYESGAWNKNGTGHWKKCARCSSTNAVEDHTTSKQASCTTKAVCSLCGEYGEVLGHNFNGSNTYLSDGTNHWKKCARCSVGDTNNKVAHSGGTATCTVKKKCTTCSASYGNLASHNYATTKTSTTEHWTVCSKCGTEQTNSRASHSGGTATCTAKAKCSKCNLEYGNKKAHSMTAYSYDTNQHWKKCANCTYADTSTKANHSGGTATLTAKPTCSDCKQSYGYKLVKHIVGSFDSDAYLYMADGSGDDFWCWTRKITNESFKNGTGALQVDPHATDGQYMKIVFNRNGSTTWNLSKAKTISLLICAGFNSEKKVNFLLKSVDSNTEYKVAVEGTNWGWPEIKINIADAKTAGVDVSKCQVILQANAMSNRQTFYVDDLAVYEDVNDTSWNTVYKSDVISYFDNLTSGACPTNVVEVDMNNWNTTVNNDKRLGSVGKGLYVVPHATNGTWPGLYFLKNGAKAFNLSNATQFSMWVYNDGTGTIKDFTLQIRTTDDVGINGLNVAPELPTGTWVHLTLDIATFRKNNPNVSLNNVWIHYGNHGSTYPNRSAFRIENVEILRQA